MVEITIARSIGHLTVLMAARLAEVLQMLLASGSINLLDVPILQLVTTILQLVRTMDHVCFLTDVPIQRHVTTIQQQRVTMDYAALRTALHSKCLIHSVMDGMERHMMSHLPECLLLREILTQHNQVMEKASEQMFYVLLMAVATRSQ